MAVEVWCCFQLFPCFQTLHRGQSTTIIGPKVGFITLLGLLSDVTKAFRSSSLAFRRRLGAYEGESQLDFKAPASWTISRIFLFVDVAPGNM